MRMIKKPALWLNCLTHYVQKFTHVSPSSFCNIFFFHSRPSSEPPRAKVLHACSHGCGDLTIAWRRQCLLNWMLTYIGLVLLVMLRLEFFIGIYNFSLWQYENVKSDQEGVSFSTRIWWYFLIKTQLSSQRTHFFCIVKINVLIMYHDVLQL